MKYEIGYIYAIWDIENPALIYYGSTGDLKHRMASHKSPHNQCSSKQIIERANYEYAILDTYENIEEYDLREREGWYIRNKPCVNIIVPHRTRAEYYQDNNEKYTEYRAEYYQDNKEKFAEYKIEYIRKNKVELIEYYADYYQKNKVKIAEHYQKNKDKLQEKFVCECGGKFTRQNKTTHEKTQRHLKYIENL